MDEDAMLWSNSAFAPARSLILALKDNRFTWKASFECCRMEPFCTSNNPAITRPTKQEDTMFHACPTIPFTSSVRPHSRASLDTVHTPLKHRRKPPRRLLGTVKLSTLLPAAQQLVLHELGEFPLRPSQPSRLSDLLHLLILL